jgi:hypothetical protein
VKDFSQECKAGLNISGQFIHFSCFHTEEHLFKKCRSQSDSSAHLHWCQICISLIIARDCGCLFGAAVHNSAFLN